MATFGVPPGSRAGTCLTCGEPARHSRAFYCEEHRPPQAGRKPRSDVSQGARETSGDASVTNDNGQVTPELFDASHYDAKEVEDPFPTSAESAPSQVTGPVETPPRKPGMFERFRSRRGRGKGTSTAPAERAPRRGRPPGRRRVALDSDISDIWAFGGRRLEATPHYATGRMLQYQAPAAGVIIDRAIAGTLPDRVLLQPIARNRDKYEDVGFLLAGPLLTFSITLTMGQMQQAIDQNDKDTFDQLATKLQAQREMFTWVLQMMLPRLAAGAKLAAEKKAKRDAAIAEAFPDLGADDPAERLATMLFTPPTFQEAHSNGTADSDPSAPSDQGSVPFGV